MPFIALGLNHQTAPIALRETVAVDAGQMSSALQGLLQQPGVREAAIVSTCNRTEIYAFLEPDIDPAILKNWLADQQGIASTELQHYLYQHQDAQAVRHLYRVAVGLDSQILGEPQILGQVKTAWQQARNEHAVSGPLDRLFQNSFAVAKRVRTDTNIGAHPVSVAYAAVRMAQQLFTALDQANVLLIGAGDTIELAAKHLRDAKAKRLMIANRTFEHAQSLAAQFSGIAITLEAMPQHLHEADIVISATASRGVVLSREMMKTAMALRRHRPMFLLDLAVPRDIAEDVSQLPDAYLYSMDDLQNVLEENRHSRREAAADAEAIIDIQVQHFMAHWQSQDHQHTLKRLRSESEQWRDELSLQAKQKIARGEDVNAVIDTLAHQLTNKLLHRPSAALRQAATRNDGPMMQAAERLFFSDDNTDPNPS